jgi:hypothetical protein
MKQRPQGDYSKAAKNLRNFAEGRGKMLRQGLITSERQNVNNVQQIIKYLQSERFKDDVKDVMGETEK